MGQTTHGARAILSNAFVYSALQRLMGAEKGRRMFVEEFVRPLPGMKVLDLGCGPADILAHLPDVDYRGFDISEEYVAQARARFGQRGTFEARQLASADLARLPEFDVVIAIGLLHHLDDDDASATMLLARQALRDGGRLLTLDPCFEPGQNPIARFLIRRDRGRNVRDRDGYAVLAGKHFDSVRVVVRHRTFVPYTHCFMECIRQ